MIFQLWYNREGGYMALFAIAIVVMIVCKVSDYQKEQKYLKSAQRRKVLKEHPEFRTPKDYW